MHDPVDIRRRIDRLVASADRRDDYGQLLASGQVIYRLGDVEAWRAEIRRQARADKIKVRTGFNDGIVWALQARVPGPDDLARRYRDLLRRTVPLAVELRHEPSIMLWDGDAVICACGRCSAAGYGDAAEDIAGGALFESDCPYEEPPKPTALAMMYVPGSRYELAGRLQDKGRLARDPTTRLSDVDIDPSFPRLPPPAPIDMPKWARTTPTDIRRWVNGGVVTIPDELLRREELAGATGPWVLVEGYLRDGDELAGRTVWGRFQALLVPELYGSRVVSALDAMKGWSEVRWPEEPGDYYTFAGEIPWSDEFAASLRHYESRPYEDRITVPRLGEIGVELLSHGYSWESHHSEANDAGGLSVPSRLLSEYAGLLRVPDGVDHADDDGEPASITASAPDGFDRGQLLYIREDLLTAYAKSRAREIIITAHGERRASYEITRRRPQWYLNTARSRSDEWTHARTLSQLAS